MSLRRTPLVCMAMLDRTMSHVALCFGARIADGADDIIAVCENGLDRDVVVIPVIVSRFSPVRPLAIQEATSYIGQVPSMCACVHTVAGFIWIGAITAAYFAPTDCVCRGLVPVEAGADHGHAEAVADADVEV